MQYPSVSLATVKHFRIFRWLIALSLFVAYLPYWDAGGRFSELYFENYYLRNLPLHLSFHFSAVVWTVMIVCAVLIAIDRFTGLALLLAGLAMLYLKNFTLFAQCKWADVFPFVLIFFGILMAAYRNRFNSKVEFPVLAVQFAELVLSLIYFASVCQRLLDVSGLDGAAAQAILESRSFSKFPSLNWEAAGPLLVALTYYSLVVESFGIFLPIAGRFRKWIILGLAPVHLGLALLSTELVWQLFSAALLFLSYSQGSLVSGHISGVRLRRVIMYPLMYFSLALFYVAALPYDTRVPFLMPVVQTARTLVSYTGIQSLTNRRLFHTVPVFATCLRIYSSDGQQIHDLESTPLKDCIDGRGSFLMDNLQHAAVRS